MSWWKSSESQRRDFKVVIYERDYKQLCAWVLKKTNIETGGDLFGLWADRHTAVIQFVVGPGQGCRRSSVSFYQDISYLEEIGSHMTKKEGLCHIGEWHSHHQLGLARPSGGDENTVWNNMPTYNLKRFVIFIANIELSRQDSYNVNIGCFLFELESVKGKERQLPVLQGTFKILPEESPFINGKLLEKRNEGAEKGKEKDIEIRDIKMEILPERPPLVSYAIKSSSSSRYKRHQPSDEKSGNQTENKKKSKIDKTATSVGDKNALGNENITPDDPKRGTATSDSNERDDSHRSQAKRSSGVRKNDEGNAKTSERKETSSAADPRPPEKKEVPEVQPGNQQSEGDANDSSASQNKSQEGTSNKEQNDDEVNVRPSEAECENSTDANDQNASNDKTQQENPSEESNNHDRREAKTEGGKSTDDPRHSKGDQNHEAQPPSQLPEGVATNPNASKDKTYEENLSEKSHKDEAKALTEGGKLTEDAEPPHEEPDKNFNQVNEDLTSRPKKPVLVQGGAPSVEKQDKSRSQMSEGDVNKHDNPQNSLNKQTVQEKKNKVDKKDGSSARKEKQAKPVQEKKSEVDKKDGSSHGPPGSARPEQKQAAKDARKDSKGKGGSQKKDGTKAGTKSGTKSNPNRPPK